MVGFLFASSKCCLPWSFERPKYGQSHDMTFAARVHARAHACIRSLQKLRKFHLLSLIRLPVLHLPCRISRSPKVGTWNWQSCTTSRTSENATWESLLVWTSFSFSPLISFTLLSCSTRPSIVFYNFRTAFDDHVLILDHQLHGTRFNVFPSLSFRDSTLALHAFTSSLPILPFSPSNHDQPGQRYNGQMQQKFYVTTYVCMLLGTN